MTLQSLRKPYFSKVQFCRHPETTLNFMINLLGYILFSLQQPLKLAKFSHFIEKIVFWETLEAPREKTVHLQELIIKNKVVYNVVFENFYSDENTVRYH